MEESLRRPGSPRGRGATDAAGPGCAETTDAGRSRSGRTPHPQGQHRECKRRQADWLQDGRRLRSHGRSQRVGPRVDRKRVRAARDAPRTQRRKPEGRPVPQPPSSSQERGPREDKRVVPQGTPQAQPPKPEGRPPPPPPQGSRAPPASYAGKPRHRAKTTRIRGQGARRKRRRRRRTSKDSRRQVASTRSSIPEPGGRSVLTQRSNFTDSTIEVCVRSMPSMRPMASRLRSISSVLPPSTQHFVIEHPR